MRKPISQGMPLIAATLCAISSLAGAAHAQTSGTFQIDNQFITGLSSPTAMAFAPDGRLFVTQQAGSVRVITAGGQLLATPFLTLPSVRSDQERGLLGIAFDPQFATNGFIYIFYTPGNAAVTRISRVTANGDRLVDGSEVVIFEYGNFSGNHRGGDIHFGPDGKLYVALGEAGEPTNSQSVTSFDGKILRINRDGTVPTDNPASFRTTSGAMVTPSGSFRAIWAIGLRNPYRFSFQKDTGAMRINDVGGGAWEEVNIGEAGANYGWPACEGTCANAYTRNPIYSHVRGPDADQGCAITGGSFYRGGQFPATYTDNYFLTDYCSTWLRHLRTDNTHITFPLAIPRGSVDLKVAPDGSLYVLGHGAGVISRVTYAAAGGNRVPVAEAVASPASGPAPLTVTFNASGSSDPDGDPLTFAWTFGDGSTGSGVTASHTYAGGGSYAARVTVADGRGGTAFKQLTISVGTPPVPTIAQPMQESVYSAGETITFSGSATDGDDGALPASAFSWTVLFHHDTHTHPALGPLNGVTSGSFTVPVTGHTEHTVLYRVYLTVTDSSGLQTQVTRDVVPRKARITLTSNILGAQVLLDGQPQVTPYSFTGVAGVQRTIEIASPQTLAGQSYAFTAWSDGGARSHVIATAATDTTYTATLTPQATSPLPEPTVHWKFDNNLTETIRGTPTSGRGTLGYSAERATVPGNVASLIFDGGAENYVAVAGDQILSGWTGATTAMWVKLTPATAASWASNSYHALLFKGGVLQTRIWKDATGQLKLVAAHGDGGAFATHVVSTTAVPTSAWVHLATVHQGAAIALYINGHPAGNGNTGRTLGAVNTGTVDIVGHGGGFLGLIDDLRLYDVALSEGQVSAFAVSTPPPPAPPAAPTGVRIIR